MAREIHDTLGHTLTGISAGVDACIAMIDSSPEVTKGPIGAYFKSYKGWNKRSKKVSK